ncbi:hypothetical protein PanWU01x14_116040, partial [Parasponia andersonii]
YATRIRIESSLTSCFSMHLIIIYNKMYSNQFVINYDLDVYNLHAYITYYTPQRKPKMGSNAYERKQIAWNQKSMGLPTQGEGRILGMSFNPRRIRIGAESSRVT